MKRKLRGAVVGYGNIGKVHAQVLAQSEDTELVAIAVRNPRTAKEIGELHSCRVYQDYRLMLEKENLDLLAICTPSGIRLDIVKAAAEAGVHLLVEKPLDINLANMAAILDITEKHNVKLSCVFQNRFKPIYQRLKEAITTGQFGKLILANAATVCYRSPDYYAGDSWRGTKALDGGGALLNQGVHSVDLLRYLLGDVKSVMAYADNLIHQIEVEDTVSAALEFVSGAQGTIQAATSVYHGINRKIELYGTKGSVILLDEKPVLWEFTGTQSKGAISRDNGKQSTVSPLITDTWAHEQQVASLVKAIREDTEPPVTGTDGYKSVELVLAIYKAAKTGKKIRLPLEF